MSAFADSPGSSAQPSTSIAALEPLIYQILSDPDTNLATISAKRVRKQLLQSDESIQEEWIKNNKQEIDALIARVFEVVNEEKGPVGATSASADGHAYGDGATNGSSRGSGHVKRKREEDEDIFPPADDDDDTPPSNASSKNKKKKSKQEQALERSDAAYARKLESELNGRARASRSTAKPTGNGKTGGRSGKAKQGSLKKARKSAAQIEDSDDDGASGGDDSNAGGGRSKKKRGGGGGGGGGAKGGFGKEFILSPALADVVSIERSSRPQVVKRLWEYIKGNNLQNPSNRREILCDDKLRAVFGDKIDMFKMNKLLGQHLLEAE